MAACALHEPRSLKRLALIGIGLIGSSIARGARQFGLADEIVVQSRRAETVETAERLKLGDRYTTSAAEAAAGADLVIARGAGRRLRRRSRRRSRRR